LSNNLYHNWIHQIQSMILPNRPLKKDNAIYDFTCQPQNYLLDIIFMIKQIELNGYSIVSCFPLRRTVMPKYVPTDTTTLINILPIKKIGGKDEKRRHENLKRNEVKLWNLFFKIEKRLFHINNRQDY